ADDSFYMLMDDLMVGRVQAPVTIGAIPVALADPAADLVAGLPGVFRTEKADPALEFRAAQVVVEGLPGAVYFEVARQDSTWSPFRQGIISPVQRKDGSTVRVFDLTGAPGLRDAIVGLWAAPEVMPKLSLESLAPNVELVVRPATGLGAGVL